jgi:hypothetical protein
VGHEEQPLPNVRSAEARSAQIGRPDGVSLRFQVSANSVEPLKASAIRNLLSKDRCRSSLADETEPGGPQVALVLGSSPLPGARNGLAGAGASPDRKLVWNPGKPERAGPCSDASEEVGLLESSEVGWAKVDHTPFVHGARRDVAAGDQVSQPGCGVAVEFVVEGGHGADHAPV